MQEKITREELGYNDIKKNINSYEKMLNRNILLNKLTFRLFENYFIKQVELKSKKIFNC